MPTERQIQEAVARCVGIMVHFHNSGRTSNTKDMMASEVQAMAGRVGEIGVKPGEADGHILRPVEAELLARYGHELGPRLTRMFLEAFGNPGGVSARQVVPGGVNRSGVP